MNKKPILLDGAAGTTLWELAESAGIKRTAPWKYNIDHPERVLELHRRYMDAVCRMIQCNTFDANPPSVTRASSYTAEQVITAAVGLAKQATAGTDVRVYLSFGPLATLLEPYGTLKKQEVSTVYARMAEAGIAAGAEAVMLETFMDVEMMRLAAESCVGRGVPVICSMTFAKRRRTMMGDTVEKIVKTLSPLGIDGIGMNCSAGPVEALEIIRDFRSFTDLPLYFKPNSGMGENYSAADFAREVSPALDFVSYIGGCCGTDAAYIREIGKYIEGEQ